VADDRRAPPGDGAIANAALVGRICRACVNSLPVTGAATSVMTEGGHRGVVFATDDTARALEDIQFTVGEGPACEAFQTGHALLVPDLDAAGKPDTQAWQSFRETARRLDVQAVFSFPLQLGAASLGALTMYHVVSGALDGENLARAVRLSNAAAFAVLDMIVGTAAVEGKRDSDIIPDDADAEFYRVEVYQAAGMVMVQLGVSIEVATMRLRSHAYVTGRPIVDVARDIVGRKLRLEADNV
jgi:ANTAR domain